MISGGGDDEVIATSYAIGINDFLPKHFTIDSLWATLAMHADRGPVEHQPVIGLYGRDQVPGYFNWTLAEAH